MRILASTRADDAAWESPQIKQGLLSYALVQNGLVDKNADYQPQDKQIVLSEWLKYGEKRVPELYAEVREGRAKGGETKDVQLTGYRRDIGVYYYQDKEIETETQQPSLFDFRRAVSYDPTIVMYSE
jgi:hypothetical protein